MALKEMKETKESTKDGKHTHTKKGRNIRDKKKQKPAEVEE